MSTRSTIAVKQSDGTYMTVYSHWNGYPSWNGRILLHHYQNRRKINRLIAQGYISILRENVGRKHDFNAYLTERDKTPAEIYNWTTFYGRDRGEKDIDAVQHTLIQSLNIDNNSEYVYVFKDGKWYFLEKNRDINKPRDLKLLTEKDIKE